MSLLPFKIGDTFQFAGAVSSWPGLNDLTGFTLVSQLRADDGSQIAVIAASVVDGPNRLIALRATNTDGWPAGNASLDVVFRAPSGDETTTATIRMLLVPRITQGA